MKVPLSFLCRMMPLAICWMLLRRSPYLQLAGLLDPQSPAFAASPKSLTLVCTSFHPLWKAQCRGAPLVAGPRYFLGPSPV